MEFCVGLVETLPLLVFVLFVSTILLLKKSEVRDLDYDSNLTIYLLELSTVF